jgi:hypothetical protein
MPRAARRARFVEHMPDSLILRFDDQGSQAELVINLDVFEMLDRLNHGYRPSLEEEQGYYLSLAVFKNVLGFAQHREILERWVETHLMDVVNRGKSNQAVAAPRPLHGFIYRFRNPKHSRDYGAAQHLYETLYHARKGAGQATIEQLNRFFFQGHDKVTGRTDNAAVLDVETQALLRLTEQVEDAADTRGGRDGFTPLCIGAADLLAEDIKRLLFYERYIPRSVMVDYLKVQNRPGALITQGRTKGAPRRFIFDSRLLEVLLQIAVLQQDTPSTPFYTGELRIEGLLTWLRERYGLHIDRLPRGDGFGAPSIEDRAALRENTASFTARLREVGFYRDLSDAYVSQMVTPRYRIEPSIGSGGGSGLGQGGDQRGGHGGTP